MEEKQKDLGAIWIKKDKNGNDYLSMKFGDKYYVCWSNKYKKSSNQPDFRIYESKQIEKKETNDIDF